VDARRNVPKFVLDRFGIITIYVKNVEKVEKMDIKTQQEQLTLSLKRGQIVKMSNIQKTKPWSDCFPKTGPKFILGLLDLKFLVSQTCCIII
jgi:hypothetical protein